MGVTNHERITRALEQLRDGLKPFVERELKSEYQQEWFNEAKSSLSQQQLHFAGNEQNPGWDVAVVLHLMWEQWNSVFKKTLGHSERSLVSELREVRKKWAHQQPFSSDDVYRALDSAARLLTAVSAPEAAEVEKSKTEVLRLRFDEQARNEKRKSVVLMESTSATSLKPWREVVTPHKDVASGQYQQAEFAADLWQVHTEPKTSAPEYRDPAEFFRRTYLTQSIRELLTNAIKRLSGTGGDPVVQLQTNFGGGKTHSLLALFHLFSGETSSNLLGVEELLKQSELPELPRVKRVIIVGNKISPGNPVTKADGTVVRTLWGELAWQLGEAAGGPKEARKAYDQIRADDEKATSPGHRLHELFAKYSPCLILIDEWVAYARQLHDSKDLPGGDFETHFTFVQTLTEVAKTAPKTLLVVSLPASESGSKLHSGSDDVEVGGERGRAALDRLRNAIGRLESSWRPASAEEGFEIVRRRLFEPLLLQDKFVARDTVCTAFYDLYRTQKQEFPLECGEGEYRRRLQAAYPIHPELFDRLYTEWSGLLKFQRTRGVLRLMAAVIHSLWRNGDKNPLIMPSNVPIDDPRVQDELTRYLSDNWVPVIERDVDGMNSLPQRLDGEKGNFGTYAACRRVARAIYLGSAPTSKSANKGIEDRRVKLACVQPGESTAIFGDALRKLSQSATYLHQDGGRYWYDTLPTVTKLAEDRAEQLKYDKDKVAREIKERVQADVRSKGEFSRVHPFPPSPSDVPDEMDARLVVLGLDHPHTKEANSPALSAAKNFVESRGSSPRLYRNSLIFLAIDSTRYDELNEAVRRFLAWDEIVSQAETLDLTPHLKRQAEEQRGAASRAVQVKLPEAFNWLLYPVQSAPKEAVTWEAVRLNGGEGLAIKASRKISRNVLISSFGGASLKLEMDKVPLWRGEGDHVAISQLIEDFARYHYLPRMKTPDVILQAIRDGLGLLSWEVESFAYAESYDEQAKRYRGLRIDPNVPLSQDGQGLLVKPTVASKQLEAERPPAPASVTSGGSSHISGQAGGLVSTGKPGEKVQQLPKRFYGIVKVDALRLNRDVAKIAEEVIQHLTSKLGSKVEITLEIQAEIPPGIDEATARTISENCRTLKFTSQEID